MESTGPTTRSRARAGTPLQTSAVPNTRRKPATRSSRKSSVPPPESVPAKEATAAQENHDTVAATDLPQGAADTTKDALTSDAEVPATVAAPNTAPIAGLTPVNATVVAGFSMGTPATMGPSPVMPIKLDSLWSPEVPQPSNNTDLAAPNTKAASPTATDAGVDLAAMFISTPAPPTAAADAGASPIEGLVSAEPSAADAAASGPSEPFAEQPFGGFAEAAMAGSPSDSAAYEPEQQATADRDQEHHAEADSEEEQASFGSPAAVAMEDASVAEMEEADLSVTPAMSLSQHPTTVATNPGLAARSAATPAAAAAAATGSTPTLRSSATPVTRSTPGRTPGRASKSPAPAGTPASPFPESDDDMPEAESEYPEEQALLAEALAEGLVLDGTTQPASVEEAVAGAAAIDEAAASIANDADISTSEQPEAMEQYTSAAVAEECRQELPVEPASGQQEDGAAAASADGLTSADQTETVEQPAAAWPIPEQQQQDIAAVPDADMASSDDPEAELLAAEEQEQHMAVEAAVQQDGTAVEAASDQDDQEQYSDEDLLRDLPSSDGEDLMSDADVPAAVIAETAADLAGALVQEDEQTAPEPAVEPETATDLQDALAAVFDADVAAVPVTEVGTTFEAADQLDTAMDCCNSPAAAEAPTPVKEAAAAVVGADATDAAAMSPEITASRSPGARISTAAPPRSAMAKPKGPATAEPKAAGRKSAHVMLPGPSPVKSSIKPTTGRYSMPGSSSAPGNDSSSSPGHTPFPTKSKVRAATSAADRAAAAAVKEVSLKKQFAVDRAHSTLKKYSASSKAEQQDGTDMLSPPAVGKKSSSSGATKAVSSRLMQPTAASTAKSRSSNVPEVDPQVWVAPKAEPCAAAAAGSSKPRLASKVVVPTPPKAESSIKSLKRAIKERTEKQAKATLAEEKSHADTHMVHDVHAMRGGKKSSKTAKAAAPPADELVYDDDDYEETYDQDYQAAADELAEGMDNLSVAVKIRTQHKPAPPLKGVAAPAGKHFVFDEEGNPMQTPHSKLRQAPKHTYFDDAGEPIDKRTSPAPRWR